MTRVTRSTASAARTPKPHRAAQLSNDTPKAVHRAGRARKRPDTSAKAHSKPSPSVGKAPGSPARQAAPPPSGSTESTKADSTTNLSPDQKDLVRSTIYDLIGKTRSSFSTICPSQVARRLHALDAQAFPDWRALMGPVRQVVWEQVRHTGRIEVTQGGEVRPYERRGEIKGPIRLRRGSNWVEADTKGDEA